MSFDWKIVYEEEKREDGSLFFPERLTNEFLENKRLILGPYIYANQYQNRVLPDGEQDFKRSWLRYYQFIPEEHYTFITIDPAISLNESADYTSVCVTHTDRHANWYVERADRHRVTATETVKLIFDLFEKYKPKLIGIETIAYQESLIHYLHDEMKRRGAFLPLKELKTSGLDSEGFKRTNRTKNSRILSLVPRFENGKILLNQGLHDLEVEYSSFPRGSHDDCIDALARMNDIVYYPHQPRRTNGRPSINDPEYEQWYIKNITSERRRG